MKSETVLNFEWDDRKNRSNIQKHGVSFNEAMTVFEDKYGILIGDPDHSATEDRFLLLGLSTKLKLLIVVHCLEGDGGRIRIISCRKASRTESGQYRR